MTSNRSIDIEQWYTKYGPMVLRRCRSILHDEDQSLDAMQEVFVKLIQNQSRLYSDYPSSLLFRMATNICLNMIRAGKSSPVSPEDPLFANLSSREDSGERMILNDFINQLFVNEPESTRDIAFMHYVDGLTYEEVASETGMSVSGIRKRLRTFKERVSSRAEEAL